MIQVLLFRRAPDTAACRLLMTEAVRGPTGGARFRLCVQPGTGPFEDDHGPACSIYSSAWVLGLRRVSEQLRRAMRLREGVVCRDIVRYICNGPIRTGV